MAVFPVKTLVPQQAGRYASFPTVCVDDANDLHFFYRLGETGRKRTHGKRGVVRHRVVSGSAFAAAMADADPDALSRRGMDALLFQDYHEMDAIVSDLGNRRYALGTRYFVEGLTGMASFLSVGDALDFRQRTRVQVPGVAWLVFYGHGFRWQDQEVFPAYGGLDGDGPLMRPLLIGRHADGGFGLLLALAEASPDLMFNESSFVLFQGRWQLFTRRHGVPFGVWRSSSADLSTWEPAQCCIPDAHAPMALVWGARLLVAVRHIRGPEEGAVVIAEPELGRYWTIDRYVGNLYDGGYADPFVWDDQLYVCYYHGNEAGEPSIRVAGPLALGAEDAEPMASG